MLTKLPALLIAKFLLDVKRRTYSELSWNTRSGTSDYMCVPKRLLHVQRCSQIFAKKREVDLLQPWSDFDPNPLVGASMF